MKIYTRRGDGGETGLYGGGSVTKASDRIEAIGEVDELNSLLGCVLAGEVAPSLRECLLLIQDDLFHFGAELASPNPLKSRTARLGQEDIDRLEAWIDHYDAELEPLRHFILPSGSPAGSQLFLARAVARRVERGIVRLVLRESAASGEVVQGNSNSPSDEVSPKPREILIAYLNRLADLLFVMARWQNRHDRVSEQAWFAETRDQRAPVSRRPPGDSSQ